MIEKKDFLDFVYIGAPRAGSTWLAAVLNEHPDVWIPHNKELHFFNDKALFHFEYKYPRGIEFYKSYFKEAPKNAKLGELSPLYYYDTHAAFRIYKHFPNVKIITMLRNPVEVIFSFYLKARVLYSRATTFEEELDKNPQILDLGFYHRQLTPYFDWFPRENIFIGIYEIFFEDEKRHVKDLFRFLGIDPEFEPSAIGQWINVSKADHSAALSSLRDVAMKTLNSKPFIPVKELLHKLKVNRMSYAGISKDPQNKPRKPRILEETRTRLMEQLEPDIARLEKLLEINLDFWRKS